LFVALVVSTRQERVVNGLDVVAPSGMAAHDFGPFGSRRKSYDLSCCMVTVNMTPTRFQERLAETEGRVDTEQFLQALQYVRDDGHR
jgi:hypothetical protein